MAVVRLHNNAVSILKPRDELTADDHYRIYVRLLQPAYVYVLREDSLGFLHALFPGKWSSKQNPLSGQRELWLPDNPGRWLYADKQPGQNRIIVVVTVERNPEFESIITAVEQPPYDRQAFDAWLADPSQGLFDPEAIAPRYFFRLMGKYLYMEKRFRGSGPVAVYTLTFQQRD